MPLFRACCYSLFRHSCLLIAFMQTLPQPARLLPHSPIQYLDGLPQFQPVATCPGIARWTVATASTAGWLRIVFAVASVSGACCHAVLTLIVRFAGVGFALHARSPARNAPDTFRAKASKPSVCYGCRRAALGLPAHDRIQQFN